MGRVGDLDRRTAADVSESDRGLGRRDPDCDDASGVRHRDGFCHGRVECGVVADDVVGGEGSDDHARMPPLQDRGCEPDRGGRVARLALEDDVRVDQLGKLQFHGSAM